MNANSARLPAGGIIDRSKPLRFRFDGKTYTGFTGDTLASALLANGVRVVGRSFKYHRPRGLMAAGVEECNALMQIGEGGRSTPNLRATEIPLHDGLVARAVNCWPNANFDVGAINNILSRFLAAGFYYKTFMWPHWHVYEWAIRRAAGLGTLTGLPDPDRYETRTTHCDVLIVGAGAAGLAAARAAGAGGARVILAEQEADPGGQLRWDGGVIEGLSAQDWIAASLGDLASHPQVRVMLNTTVTGYFDHNALTMLESVSRDDPMAPATQPRARLWQVRARRVILATGAIERPLVFPGNDRPGIMLAGAVRQYIARYAVRPGKALLVFTNNDEAYHTAIAFHRAGGSVGAVADTRPRVEDAVRAPVEALGIPILQGAAIFGTAGTKGLRRVTLLLASGKIVKVVCDCLAMSGGSNPDVQLHAQSGGTPVYDAMRVLFRPGQPVQAEQSVGAANGLATLHEALRSGHDAGREAAAEAGFPAGTAPFSASLERAAPRIIACWPKDPPHGKAFVDLQNDVTTADVALSARENFVSIEHLKRYTTLGMATDQGKTSSVNALAQMAQLTGTAIGKAGTTRFRFPYTPVPFGAFAGRAHGKLFRPTRHLPVHDWHVANGAIMEDFGGWLRPAAYLAAAETRQQAERREVRAVREHAGLFDASPLGKIEVRGPKAAWLLDFIYANTMSTLKPCGVRYGLLLNERGIVMDDGVCTRLAEDHFIVGSSSGGAERTAAMLEEWHQCDFPDLDVLVAPVTTGWAVLTVTGPKARAVLQAAGTDFPIGPDDFPHMSCRCGTVAGVPARVMRVSFTGEVSFEINVAADRASQVWDALDKAGRPLGLLPIGLDALNVLRLEKGYLHIGADTDGTTTPLNIGWERVLKRKADFVGKQSLLLPVNRAQGKLQLVGLTAADGAVLPIGAHAVQEDMSGRRSDGFVTSSGYSPTLQRGVALAMIHGGAERLGQELRLDTGALATICTPAAYDPEGARCHG